MAVPPAGALSAYLRSRVATRAGEDVDALGSAQAAVDADPADPRLRLHLAERLFAAAQPDAARSQLELALHLGALPWEVARIEAIAGRRAGSKGVACARLASAAEGAPSSYFALWADIAAEVDTATLDAATSAWVAALPGDPMAWRRRGAALVRAGRSAEAAAAFDKAAELPDGFADGAAMASRQWRLAGDIAAARASAELCMQRYDDNPRCHAVLARVLDTPPGEVTAPDDAPVPAETRAALLRLAALVSGNARSFSMAARAVLEENRPAVARVFGEEAVSIRPRNPGLLLACATLFERVGAYDQADDALLRIIAIDPNHHTALNHLGYTWADRNVRLDEALAYLQRALAQRPDDPGIKDSVAWALYRLGRFEEAEALQAQAVAEEPESAVLLDHYGDILMALRRRDEAIRFWRLALRHAGADDEDVAVDAPRKLREQGVEPDDTPTAPDPTSQ